MESKRCSSEDMASKLKILICRANKLFRLLPENISSKISLINFENENKFTITIDNYKKDNYDKVIELYDSSKDGIFDNSDKFQQFLLDELELYLKNRNLHNSEEISKIRANI